MDDFTLLRLKAATLRLKQAAGPDEDSLGSRVGPGLTTLGGLAAGAGYGGEHLANKHLAQNYFHPKISDGWEWLRSKLPANAINNALGPRPPVSMDEAAQFMRRNGRNIGRAGLGVGGLGLIAWLAGRGSDVNSARAGLHQSQGELAQMRDQLGQAQGEAGGLRALLAARRPRFHTPPPTPQPSAPAPTGRQQLAKSMLRRAASGLGDWWQRMQARYGGQA